MTAAAGTWSGWRSRAARVRAPLALAGTVAAATVVLHLRDPHDSGSYLFCPWLLLTGTYCPGCGGLRAVNDLTHGDVGSAASSNLLFVVAIPLLVWLWSRWFVDSWRGRPHRPDQRAGVIGASVFGAVALAFWVARNLPGLDWLAP